MDWSSNVTVHESAFPASTRRRILDALKSGEIDPALLYQGLGQTLRWTALHAAYSPARTDSECAALYDEPFRRAAADCNGNVAHVVSLACGDGTKDARCLQSVRESGRAAIYTPADISLEMVLSAERTVAGAVPGAQCTPLACDLAHCSVLPGILKTFDPSGAERIILFLGTIHNYWPPDILRSILYPLRSQDQLVIGANLAPEADYDRALQKILLQYDNGLTREWLMGALRELNISETDGHLEFSLPEAPSVPSLKRIQVDFAFGREKEVQFFGETVRFAAGQRLRVFFSYRFTPAHIRGFLKQAGLAVREEWISASGEEGLFLCKREASAAAR
jgi:L-histidine Nalpha-methyltransferase